MNKIHFFVILFLSAFVAADLVENLHITKIVDGDTVHATHAGKLYKIRLTEIDAPERDQPGGLISSAYLSALLVDGFIDADFSGKDIYGRDLGRIYINDRDINRLMVRAGMAWVYDDYVTDPSFYNDQTLAKKANSGLWESSTPVPPWDWRRGKRTEVSKKDTYTSPKEINTSPKTCCRICRKGKACGNSCIKRSFNCTKSPGCACNS